MFPNTVNVAKMIRLGPKSRIATYFFSLFFFAARLSLFEGPPEIFLLPRQAGCNVQPGIAKCHYTCVYGNQKWEYGICAIAKSLFYLCMYTCIKKILVPRMPNMQI